jgi:hypothetical protein
MAYEQQKELSKVIIGDTIYLIDPSTEFQYKEILVKSMLIQFNEDGNTVLEINKSKVYKDWVYFYKLEDLKTHLINIVEADYKTQLARLRRQHEIKIKNIKQ